MTAFKNGCETHIKPNSTSCIMSIENTLEIQKPRKTDSVWMIWLSLKIVRETCIFKQRKTAFKLERLFCNICERDYLDSPLLVLLGSPYRKTSVYRADMVLPRPGQMRCNTILVSLAWSRYRKPQSCVVSDSRTTRVAIWQNRTIQALL